MKARRLAEQGARVVIGARRTDRLETLSAELCAGGGEVIYFTMDVTRRREVADFARFARDRLGGLDVMVNNAGVMAATGRSTTACPR